LGTPESRSWTQDPRVRSARVALISPDNRAALVGYTSTVGEARRIAEGWVRSRQPLA